VSIGLLFYVEYRSNSQIFSLIGEDSTEIMKAVQCPQLIMPAATDPVADKTGGEHVQVGVCH